MKKQVWSGLIAMMLVLVMTTVAFAAGAKVKKTEAKFRNDAVMVQAELKGVADSATIEIAEDKNFKKKVVVLNANFEPCYCNQSYGVTSWKCSKSKKDYKFEAAQFQEGKMQGASMGEWEKAKGVKSAISTAVFSKNSMKTFVRLQTKNVHSKKAVLYVRVKPVFMGIDSGKFGKPVKAKWSKNDPTAKDTKLDWKATEILAIPN